ncbi:MAG: hypothetical protein R2827_03805 [Bdellovibrionales bacterium]
MLKAIIITYILLVLTIAGFVRAEELNAPNEENLVVLHIDNQSVRFDGKKFCPFN